MKTFCLLAALLLAAPFARGQGLGVVVNGSPTSVAPNVPYYWNGSKFVPVYGTDGTSVGASGGGGSGGAVTVTPTVSTTSNDTGPVTVTTTSGTALAASTRLNASIVNYGAAGCFISLTGTAAVGKGIYLAPGGGSYSIDANNLYRGIITAITASGTTTLSIHEGQ